MNLYICHTGKDYEFHNCALNSDIYGITCDDDDDDDDDDEGRINFSVALSPKTTRTRNNKSKQ